MTLKLQQIDELLRPQHYFVEADDRCYFLREYTARAGYSHGETNQLIFNLKKKLDRRGRPDWHYKESAMVKAGRELRAALGDNNLGQATIVPMPPSLSKSNPMYDDRMLRVVQEMTRGLTCDVRELVVQPNDMPTAHENGDRPSPDDWYSAYVVDEAVATPAPTRVLVIDDVLTAGAHFAGSSGACWSVFRASASSVSSTRAARSRTRKTLRTESRRAWR